MYCEYKSLPPIVCIPFRVVQQTCFMDTLRKSTVHFLHEQSHKEYHQTSSISRPSLGNKFVGHSDVAGASPVGAAPNTSSFST